MLRFHCIIYTSKQTQAFIINITIVGYSMQSIPLLDVAPKTSSVVSTNNNNYRIAGNFRGQKIHCF